MGRVGSGIGLRRCCGGWGSNRSRLTSWWTSIMRWSIWARSRPSSGAGRHLSVRLDRSPAAPPAQRRVRGGASGDRCRVWFAPGKALKRERDDFKRNGGKGRMDDARVAALKSPIGSGAIESAIRRVVNLRLKGPSIYWHKTSAEAVCWVTGSGVAGVDLDRGQALSRPTSVGRRKRRGRRLFLFGFIRLGSNYLKCRSRGSSTERMVSETSRERAAITPRIGTM